MRPPEPSPRGVAASRRPPPLTQSRKRDGCPYVRHADTEEEVSEALATEPANWKPCDLSSECIVHLIRTQIGQSDKTVMGRLLEVIMRRTTRIATDNSKGFDQVRTEEIVTKVGEEVIGLILADAPSRKSEFLEISFRLAVKRKTLNLVESKRAEPRQVRLKSPSSDSDDTTGKSASAGHEPEDPGPGPVDVAIESEELALTGDQIRVGLAAITDERHREAIILHYLHGWPVTDKDSNTPTLENHFRVSDRTIRKWFERAKAEMRFAIGEKP